MAKRLLWWFVAALAAGVAYAALYRSVQPVGTPQGQIRGALMEALDALQHGRASAAMSVVAPDYKDSTGFNRDRLYILARQATENREWWSATIARLEPTMEGNEATVALQLAVRRTEGGTTQTEDMTVRLRNDKVYAYGIAPTHRWRVISATNIPNEVTVLGE
ncbi:MAG TPA: hypothetical protein VGM37_15035 [Armatimonadota bacterium]|jgi:hypothetical protein